MSRESIPDDVKRFILTSIPSIPYLETLLLLRSNASRLWLSAEVARRIYISEKAAHALLQELRSSGFIDAESADPEQYRYAPVNEELRDMIDRLAQSYSKNLVDVTELIHSKINKRAKQFADAFIWRKDS
jgi:DNA-binding IclR family transcriptional regulator